ncbi:acyl-ACP thioesterase [Tanacetum coccineum]|uniref:Acyl-ACP thioesterase n=1 Tax=Tanacetum coccineum TaxID=301880 RepID=A0ABQ5IFV2_9ASTR
MQGFAGSEIIRILAGQLSTVAAMADFTLVEVSCGLKRLESDNDVVLDDFTPMLTLESNSDVTSPSVSKPVSWRGGHVVAAMPGFRYPFHTLLAVLLEAFDTLKFSLSLRDVRSIFRDRRGDDDNLQQLCFVTHGLRTPVSWLGRRTSISVAALASVPHGPTVAGRALQLKINLLLIIRAKEKGRRDLDGNLEEGLRRVGFELMESEIKDLAYGQFLKANGEERTTTKRSSSMDEKERKKVSMLLASITTIFLAAEKQWMTLDWKPKRTDMLADLDSFGFGRLVEDGFMFRQNFSIRSYEIGADHTASVETLMNHLQVL